MNSYQTTDSDKFLYKLIIQFALFSRGANDQLDPHIDNIMQRFKQGIKYQELMPDLMTLSKTLLHVSKTGTDKKVEPRSELQYAYFISHLNKLLDETDIPFEFKAQCKKLKRKASGQINDETYKEIVDAATSLLINIKSQTSTEQQVIESFLVGISEQISSLGEQTSHVSDANSQSLQSNEQHSHAIDEQVDNIKNSTAEAKELSSLQQSINQHLQELSSQLHKHQETEVSRQLQTQKQLALMTKKMQEMEAEAETLRSNLKVAHNKALRDALTGLPNRLAYDERIEVEYKYWQRYKTPLSLVIWDIDLFKNINDTYGHKAGDKTLAIVAQLISDNCRETDFVARFGGEEFVMLLPNTLSRYAFDVAEKIRCIIAKSSFQHNDELIQITISAGISEYTENDNHEAVFERADKALYLSKEQGRNKCSVILP